MTLFWPFCKIWSVSISQVQHNQQKHGHFSKFLEFWTLGTLGNDHVFVITSNFESENHIWLRNFHEQQNFQLKPIINRVYKRDSLFQIQTVCFICSIQQQIPNSCKAFISLVQIFWKRVEIDASNFRFSHQHHLKRTLSHTVTLVWPFCKVWSVSVSQVQHNQHKR